MNTRIICLSIVLAIAGMAYAANEPTQWTPPKTSLPKSFVDAAGFAFEHGLADPTGGEFREVTTTCSVVWPDKGPKFKVTGWLMPAKGSAKAFVICWNGLPYRNFEMGSKIDLAAFVKERALKGNRDGEFSRRNSEDIDANDPVTSVGMAFMLRLNRSDLAEALAPTKEHLLKSCARQLLADIVWFRHNRAVLAFLRNDNPITKEDSQWIVENYENFKDKSQPVDFNQARFDIYKTLFADADGRIKLGNRSPFDPIMNARLPIKERVADIIKNLDEATARMWYDSDPQWVGDPIYTAAMETGEPMLDALVDCLEKDKRLTRNDGNHRTPSRGHNLIPVSRLALTLIQNITAMKTMPRLNDGKTDFTTLRAEVKAIKGLGLAERCFALLLMDSASPSQWVEAAQMLVRANNVTPRDGGIYFPPFKTGDQPSPLHAESLKNKMNPSLTDVLIKRAWGLMPTGLWSTGGDSERADDAISLAECLVKWDPQQSRATIKELDKRLAATQKLYGKNEYFERSIAPMTDKLVRLKTIAGDPEARKVFEATVTQSKPSGDLYLFRAFAPLIAQPDWGNKVTQAMFVGKDGQWSVKRMIETQGVWYLASILQSKVLVLTPVRQSLIEALKDKREIGSIQSDGALGLRYTVDQGGSGSIGFGQKNADFRDPKGPMKMPLRVCDLVASYLQQFKGAPRFRLFWSAENRDSGCESMISYIRWSGEKLVDYRFNRQPFED